MTPARHTVLVVDDEAEVVETLKRNLRGEPFTVVGTTSPAEAIALIEAGGIDLLVADIDMPEMDGLSLVARIQRTHPHVIRILLTGDASLESAMTAINEGEVHRYLTKPWSTTELREILRSALDRVTELRRAGQVSHDVAKREAFLLELEKEHPGIRRVVREDGAYVIDAGRMRQVIRMLTDDKLRELFDAEATRGPRRSEPTRRSAD